MTNTPRFLDAEKMKKFLRETQQKFAMHFEQDNYTGATDALAAVDAEITSGRLDALSPPPAPHVMGTDEQKALKQALRDGAKDVTDVVGGVYERLFNSERVALWDAINKYTVACRGKPDKYVYGNTTRMDAVSEVERICQQMPTTRSQTSFEETREYDCVVSDIKAQGHTDHCAKRIVYGDGCCECKDRSPREP